MVAPTRRNMAGRLLHRCMSICGLTAHLIMPLSSTTRNQSVPSMRNESTRCLAVVYAMCACVLFHASTGITTSRNMLTVTRAKLMQLKSANAEHWILPWILTCIHIGVVVCSCQKPIEI